MRQKNSSNIQKAGLLCFLREVSVVAFILSTTILTFTALHAQSEEEPALMVDLINRVGAVESENRELRGQVEEARHEISQLTKRMETLSADLEYRLTNPESGSHPPVPLGPPSPLASDKKTTTPSSVAVEKAPATSSSPVAEKMPENSGSSTSEEYEKARALLERGDYAAAEHAFSAFVSSHPKDKLAGAAQYWLGVTYFVRGEHEKAASTFAKGCKDYPKSSKASDNLLKLAKSLAALDRKADACTTLDQLASEYPKALVKEVSSERKKLECK